METKKNKRKGFNWRRAISASGNLFQFHKNYNNRQFKSQSTIGVKSEKESESRRRYQVGLKSRVHHVTDILHTEPLKSNHDVFMLVICGEEGIGKTTIATVVYRELLCRFESGSFIANVKEIGKNTNGIVRLQQKLLSDICNGREIQIDNVENGKSIIDKTLSRRKVFVVLDDVDAFDQLNALCGSVSWFGKGSRIIITTNHEGLLNGDWRNEGWLNKNWVTSEYIVRKLDVTESLELLSWYAFKEEYPEEDFEELLRAAVDLCKGLPLALEVLGSYLFGRKIAEWESALEILLNDRGLDIMNLLKVGFYGCDDMVKYIFLNICDSYIGKDRDNTVKQLEEIGFSAEIGIDVLEQRCLLSMDMENKFMMHGLLQTMGNQIFHERSLEHVQIGDVFLSFRGADTRNIFTGHLYASLANAGISTFMDDTDLVKGENIKSGLLRAIEGSRVCVIVFSISYAYSRWCLDELVKIMELRRTNNLLVLPIFYGVEPSDVRNQTGSFTLALKNHKRNFSWEKILSWTRALTEAGNLNGWHITDGHEAKIINEIVNYISRRLDMTYLFVAQYPVGVEARVQAMMELLGSGSDCVRIVGILGMGGIGKTTIAKAVYNEIRRDFEGGTFLANVRENWGQHDGPGHLQQQLLTDVFLENKTQIRGLEWGIILLKERLRHRRILVVLDDVDKLEQLNALCGSRDWFCPGSRIIIAPRDENLLNVLKVDEVYLMGEMDLTESLELFSQHAFKEKRPKEDFAKLSRDVVTYSGGLPLALEVLGSYLFGRKIPQWKSTLEKLKRIPNDQVQQKLKISFEGLNDDKLKDIFLDISCFFIGMNINDVVEISNGCGFFAEIGITILMERCLITVDSKNKLRMHDLLRDMGREIVREKWPKEPEERSRLWWHEDVCDVLTKHMGTKSIEGLTLKLSRLNKENFRTEAFKKIKRLRLLQFHHVQLTGEYEYISKDLRWLCWHGFPLRSIPTDLYQQRLVSMDLRYSNLKLLWKHPVLLEGLKILNLSHCHFLTQTPDFLELPNLEKLILKDCPNLSAVHESIGCLNGLVLVNLRDCKCLGNLPRSIYKLKAVKTLILSGCSKIDRLEEDLEQMESLTTLIADNTGIKQMPFSIVKLKSIWNISVCGHQGSSCDVFPSLIWSWMSPKSSLQLLNHSFGSLTSLSCFDRQNNNFYILPSTNNGLSELQTVRTECGSQIPAIQDLASNLNALYLRNLRDLYRTLDVSEISNMVNFSRTDCESLVNFTASENFWNTLMIHIGGFRKVKYYRGGSILQGWTATDFGDLFLPGACCLDLFIYKAEGPLVSFEVPHVVDGSLAGFTVGIVYSSSLDRMSSQYLTTMLVINHTKDSIQMSMPVTNGETTFHEDHLWQGILSNMEGGDKVVVILDFGYQFAVKEAAVYLVYGKSIDKKMIECQPVPNKVPILSGEFRKATGSKSHCCDDEAG